MMNSILSIVVKQSQSKKLLLKFWCLFIIVPCSSLGQIGSWQSHASYQSGQSVAVAGNLVFAATQNGFFYYNKTTNETVALSKKDGLSDVSISQLLYFSDQKRLLIAYRNGNLDFLSLSAIGEPGSVLNINTIVSASNLPASRRVNHINRIGDNAYLSTDFGLVVLDLLKNEIRDTWFSQRADGSALPIYQTAATADSLYALTAPLRTADTGRQLRSIRFSASVNIADPANWQALTAPGTQIESIISSQGRLSATVNGQGIYERQAGRWSRTQLLNNAIIRLFPTANAVILATEKTITLPGAAAFAGPLLTDPREVVADGNGVWVADTQNGLLSGSSAGFQRIVPEGPAQDLFTSLYAYPQTLVVTAQNATRPPVETFSVPNGRWQQPVTPGLPTGFNSAAYLPGEQRLYLGSNGGGLWSQADGQSLVSVTLPNTITPLISSLSTDFDGNLWIATAGSGTRQTTLHVRRPDGQFQSFPAISQSGIVQIVPDDYGFLWLRLNAGGGILVFDPQTNRSRFLSSQAGQGGLPASSVRTLVKDRTGVIWVGTDLGPTVFDNPGGAFDASIDAQPPLLNRRRLLANVAVTAIAVDGGNRKWIGTPTGLYHVAPDGSQLLDTFTADTSPLPASSIQHLAVEPLSGKVFIATPNGLVSYQGSATEPAELLTKLTIFPNPVRPDFTGTVGINGLTDNTTVKILDAAGQLVYETRSQGGTATWNLNDYRGRVAQTGIYLIVVVTNDGTESLAGKLAVVR